MSEAFDQYSRSYQDVVEQSIRFSSKEHDFFLRAKYHIFNAYLKDRFGKEPANKPDALDVGCGIGALHPFVRPLFNELSGVDISTDSIEQAKARTNSSVDYRAYDGKRLPFDDNQFDFTYAVCVLHHVPPQNWQGFVSEMARVTRPNGTVAIIEHNPFNPLTRLAVARCPFDHDAVLLTKGKCQKLFSKTGLRQQDGRYFLLSPSEHRLAQSLETKMSSLPFGAQYALFGTV